MSLATSSFYGGILLFSLLLHLRVFSNPTTESAAVVIKSIKEDQAAEYLSTWSEKPPPRFSVNTTAEWKFLVQLLGALEILYGEVDGKTYRQKDNKDGRQLDDDEEIMLGDQPSEDEFDTFGGHHNHHQQSSVTNSTKSGDPPHDPSNATIDQHQYRRALDRNRRVTEIRLRIENLLSKTYTEEDENVMLQDVAANVRKIPPYVPNVYLQKIILYVPSCNVPRHMKKDEWNSEEQMNLYFDVNFPKQVEGTNLYIQSGQLRLYKLRSKIDSTSESEESLTELKDAIKQNGGLSDSVANASLMAALSEENQIHVSIYYYTKTMKKHRIKKTLVASSMLSRYQEGWTEWNIQRAVNAWRKDSSKNYGLVVIVEDDENNVINATKIFSMVNCSIKTSSTSTLVSSVVVTATSGIDNSTSKTANNNFTAASRVPNLQVTMTEIPNSEEGRVLLYRYTKLALEQQIDKTKRDTAVSLMASSSSSNSEHRIRHDHRKISLYNATNIEDESFQNHHRQNKSNNTNTTTTSTLHR